MKQHTLKISLAQVNVKIGDFEEIFKTAQFYIEKAKGENADLIVFPELFVCGYPPLDMLEHNQFLKNIEETEKRIAKLSDSLAVVFGSPAVNPSGKGKSLYNAARFCYKGKIIQTVCKGLIPNYDVFDENRYFEAADSFNVIHFRGERIALTICEDLWDKSATLEYKFDPMQFLMKQNPTVIINIAASPFDYLKDKVRKEILTKKAGLYNLPLFYVNHTGAQTELIFDGGSKVIRPDGTVFSQMKFFAEDFRTYSLSDVSGIFSEDIPPISDIEKIYSALIAGIRDYFIKSGFTSAVIGLSGGIDSALVAVLASEALGKENVHCVYLPTAFSSETSLNDAQDLAQRAGTSFSVIPVEQIYRNTLELLHPFMNGKKEDITEENIQSRLRGVILMAHANKFGYILLNTSNKSEMATGYGTLYGDMCGALSVIGDLYKTQVYELCRYINRDEKIIPENILTKEPTAELKYGQKDTDTLPPYEILDKILFHYLELNENIKTIEKRTKSDKDLISGVLRMVNANEFKRFQAPPVLRISPKAFGLGRRFPIVAQYSPVL